MDSETFRRIGVLKAMEARLRTLRPQLEEIGHTDFFHLDEVMRLITDMLAEPASSMFADRGFALNWHLKFLWAEYAQLKGLSTDDPAAAPLPIEEDTTDETEEDVA